MAEMSGNGTKREYVARHRSRGAQVWIYLGKLLRTFVYQSDWKLLPMAALVAGLVGMVIRRRMFLNMEGTLMGAFALVCVCIWNGAFNSIQVICRERDVIKREHRSGMHISSYIFSHMLYQFLLCAAQTAITLYVVQITGVEFPKEGLMTPWFIVDMGISMILITYASDMLSLWVSSLAHTTTTAMTIMPFVLIFQLVFSGGMLKLPAWTEALTPLTISNPGLKVLAAQADTNNRPFVTISDMVERMRDNEIGGEITLGQALDALTDKENPAIAKVRAVELGAEGTLEDVWNVLKTSGTVEAHRGDVLFADVTLGDALDLLGEIENTELWVQYKGAHVGATATIGSVVDYLAANPDVIAHREDTYAFSTTLGAVIDLVGEEEVKTFLQEKAAAASYVADYALTEENVTEYWAHLIAFIILFALLATVTLEFIDKDKR